MFVKNDNEFICVNCNRKVEKLKYPVIVKPATLGSSVGISVAHNKEELTTAIEDAITYDNKIVVEEVVENLTEVNISVLGNYEHANLSEIEQELDIMRYNLEGYVKVMLIVDKE